MSGGGGGGGDGGSAAADELRATLDEMGVTPVEAYLQRLVDTGAIAPDELSPRLAELQGDPEAEASALLALQMALEDEEMAEIAEEQRLQAEAEAAGAFEAYGDDGYYGAPGAAEEEEDEEEEPEDDDEEEEEEEDPSEEEEVSEMLMDAMDGDDDGVASGGSEAGGADGAAGEGEARENVVAAMPHDEFVARVAASENREIGAEAVWTLSTAKPGNGVEQLRDGDTDTFWQSDGVSPHLVNIQFHKRMRIRELAVYADYKLDESYTPARLSVRAGSAYHDLVEVQQAVVDEPTGWFVIPLPPPPSQERAGGGDCLEAHLVQLSVLASHQNGRDTHIRQIRVYGPRPAETVGFSTELSVFTTPEFKMFASVR